MLSISLDCISVLLKADISLFAQLNKETVNRAVRPIFIAIKLAERKTHERHNDFKGWDNN